jgi:excisionase family DNA binding protein
MDCRRPNENLPYPTLSGDPSTDLAVWGLSAALWKIAKEAVAREVSAIHATCEKRPEVNTQPLGDIVEADRLLLKTAEVAAMMAVGRSKVYEMLQTGELPSVRMGRCIRVPRRALEKWIAER